MRFSFSAEQLEFRDALSDLLDKECTAADVRAMWDDDRGRSADRWSALAAMGVVGLTVPEPMGGLGGDEVDLILLLEAAGRAALPEPLAETTAVAVPLLASVSPGASSTWLPRVASGRAVLAVGHEASPYVSDAHIADLLLLQRGDQLHGVAPAAVSLTAQPSVDAGRRLFRVSWEPSASTCLAEGPPARAALDAAFDRAAMASSAQLLGLGDRLVGLAAEHARQRHQFGRPIGSFQAVKHLLADVLLALEFARPCTYRAAFSVAHDDPQRAVHVSMAKAYASEAASLAARVALQVHGAIGYTWEHDLHLYMKKVWALASAWGDASWHRARIADALLPLR